jgi:hypothetical protein
MALKVQRKRIFGAKLGVLLGAIALAGCDGGVHLSARVVDSEGRPIAGALAALQKDSSPPEFEGTSEKSGCLSVGGLTAPGKYNFTLMVHAPGYKELNLQVPTIERNALRLVLARQEQAFISQAIPVEAPELENVCGAI